MLFALPRATEFKDPFIPLQLFSTFPFLKSFIDKFRLRVFHNRRTLWLILISVISQQLSGKCPFNCWRTLIELRNPIPAPNRHSNPCSWWMDGWMDHSLPPFLNKVLGNNALDMRLVWIGLAPSMSQKMNNNTRPTRIVQGDILPLSFDWNMSKRIRLFRQINGRRCLLRPIVEHTSCSTTCYPVSSLPLPLDCEKKIDIRSMTSFCQRVRHSSVSFLFGTLECVQLVAVFVICRNWQHWWLSVHCLQDGERNPKSWRGN